jgi:hypothetical protein
MAMSLGDVGDDDVGLLVRVQALLRSARYVGGDALLIRMVDGPAELTAFIPDVSPGSPDPRALQPGARIEVTGEVVHRRSEVEIEAAGPGAVSLVAPAGSEPAPLRALLDAPEYYRGMKVRTTGSVGEFTIANGDLTVRLADAVQGAAAQMVVVVRRELPEPVVYRDEVEVVGTMGYGYETGPGWRIVVQDDGHELSRGAASHPGTAARATLPELASDPERFADQLVHVVDAIVMDTSDVAGTSTSLTDGPDRLEVFISRRAWGRTDLLPGDAVSVVGRLEYYRPRGSWELVVESPDDFTSSRAR